MGRPRTSGAIRLLKLDFHRFDVYGSRVVQFSHFSVKEFLTSKRIAAADGDVSQYHILPGPAHTILTQACLGVLLRLDVGRRIQRQEDSVG